MRWLVGLCLCVVPSCAALDWVIPIMDPDTGEQVGETTVGDAAAGVVEGSSGAISDALSGVVGVASGNPALGGAVGVGALGLLAAGAAALRRKKAD